MSSSSSGGVNGSQAASGPTSGSQTGSGAGSGSGSGSASGSGAEDLYQIAILIDQLKHDDSTLRVNAANNLVRIASALGPDRTRDELIPFLCESTDDEDDVLRTITEQLGEMVDCVGGDQYIHILLEPLELLSTVEESSVRNSAIKSISKIVEALPADHLETYFAPFVMKLAAQEWFTSRISAASLFPVGYSRLPEKEKASFRSTFIRMCGDETPLVRRVIAQHFGDMAAKLSTHELNAEFLGAFDSLSKDDQDAVRIQSISSAIAIAKCLTMQDRIARMVPMIVNIAADKSWRVRWSLASQLHEMFATLGEPAINRSIGQLAVVVENLLSDNEAEVFHIIPLQVLTLTFYGT
jgi:serine/threonine-protein phosphatase 2A regulatory subunit A